MCSLQEDLGRRLAELDKIGDREEIIDIKQQMENNKTHTCLKNFSGPSKSMETNAIVQLIKMEHKEVGAYVRVICMDNDTITRSHIQADLGPGSKGYLPQELARILAVADPSHRKRTVSNWYWALVNKPVAECALTGDQAKLLVTHFAHF